MTSRTLSAVFSFLALFAVSSAWCVPPQHKQTLDEILQRLQANLNHFDTGVPSFFCDEHVISQMESDQIERNIIESVFRLKRTSNKDHTTTLVESRDIKSVDGKPPTKQNLEGPSLLSGWFEGGLALVSLNQTDCMSYALERTNGKPQNEPYVIRFSPVASAPNSASCLLQEKSKGRVIIDAASMQITRLEITTPRHAINSGNWYSSSVVGERVLTIDYAPVALSGDTFWMPSTITMRVTKGKGRFNMIVWSFHATYNNYHEMEVTYRIVPGSERPLQ